MLLAKIWTFLICEDGSVLELSMSEDSTFVATRISELEVTSLGAHGR
jgi:hypothetical protein